MEKRIPCVKGQSDKFEVEPRNVFLLRLHWTFELMKAEFFTFKREYCGKKTRPDAVN